MIGHTTRRCDEIGKTFFKIYDPVVIYAALEDATIMKPVLSSALSTANRTYGTRCVRRDVIAGGAAAAAPDREGDAASSSASEAQASQSAQRMLGNADRIRKAAFKSTMNLNAAYLLKGFLLQPPAL
jgi:hypothetical protein